MRYLPHDKDFRANLKPPLTEAAVELNVSPNSWRLLKLLAKTVGAQAGDANVWAWVHVTADVGVFTSKIRRNRQ